MKRRPSASWFWLVLAALAPARAAVRDVPVVPASVGSAPTSAGASVTAQVPTGPAVLAAPPALPASVLPAAAPVSAVAPDGLGALRRSLEERGDSEAMAMAQKIHFIDSLTGLPNRAFLTEKGDMTLQGFRDPAVSLLDMNNFGAVNVGLAARLGVTKGRARADSILAVAGAVLGELAREHGVLVARLGGEEFAVLGSRDKVLAFAASARREMPSERLLDAAGLTKDGEDRRAVEAAMAKIGRGGQPVGDFTYGVAPARGRTVEEALDAADGVLTGAKDSGGRGGIFLVQEDGSHAEWVPPAEDHLPSRELPKPSPARTAESVAGLEARLTPRERELFRESTFKDPLTQAQGYDYIYVRAAEWEQRYRGGGAVAAVVSGRNLKQINDILGHETGDVYLRGFGKILLREVARARRARLDVQEPVRVASKEFLLVGRDAAIVASRTARAVEKSFDGGILSKAQVAHLRQAAVSRGAVPAARVRLIGTLRVITEPLAPLGEEPNVRNALDRAFERLEMQKRADDAADLP